MAMRIGTMLCLKRNMAARAALWHVLYVMAVYTLSVLLTWGMMQVPYLRAFVVRDNSSPARLLDVVRLGARPRWTHQRSR